VSLRYQVLTICEKYGLNPEKDWEELSKQTKMDMIAKLILDNERDERLRQD